MQETVYTLSSGAGPKQMTFAVAADLHDHPYTQTARMISKRHPDFIFCPGDFIKGELPSRGSSKMKESRYALEFLRALAEIAPTAVSLGNHEWMLNQEDFELIRNTGVILLDNEYRKVQGLVIGGLTSGRVMRCRRSYPGWRNGEYRKESVPYCSQSLYRQLFPVEKCVQADMLPDTAWLRDFVSEPGYHILLSHHPEYWSYPPVFLGTYYIDLILSGHAHGGQIRYPSLSERRWKGLFAPHQGLFPEYTSGIFTEGKSAMIISRGLSNTAGFLPRLFNRREIVYIELPAQNNHDENSSLQ